MKLKMLLIFVIFAFFIAFISCEKKLGKNTLLTIGQNSITTDEFFKSRPRDQFINLSDNHKRNVVEKFAKNQLLLHEAIRSGFSRKNSVITTVNSYKKNMLKKNYLNRTIFDSIVTEDVLVGLYEKSWIEFKASHILISVKGKRYPSGYSKELAYERASEVYNLALSGTPFSKLANKYSDDKATSKKGGDLGYFQWGKMLPEFQDAAFSMKVGEISQPVLTSHGYHIIKLESRIVKNRPPFEKAIERLKRIATRQYLAELQKSYKKLIDSIIVNYEFNTQNNAIDHLVQLYNNQREKMLSKEKYCSNPPNFATILNSIQLNEVLLFYKGGRINKNSLAKEFEKQPNYKPKKLIASSLKQILEQIAISKIIIKDAIKMQIDKTEEFQNDVQKYQKQTLISSYKNAKINAKIKANDNNLRSFYKEYKDSLYSKNETVEVQ